MGSDERHVRDYYELGGERERLEEPLGIVEFERTKEIVLRHLPPPPATIADIGGGPGRYALWLAQEGYEVFHRDIVPLHVEQLARDTENAGASVDSRITDARSLDLGDASVDGVLLLGPLYHLTKRVDRVQALREARRVVRPGGPAFVAAISRWAPRLHAVAVLRLYEQHPAMLDMVPQLERSGRMPPLFPRSFAGYCHRPGQLRTEVHAAGLEPVDLVGVEGIAFALPDLEERLASERSRAVVFDVARAIERVPELLGLGPHLLLTARRSRAVGT